MVMPPKEGIAIGTIMSEPLPVEVRTGIWARKPTHIATRRLFSSQKHITLSIGDSFLRGDLRAHLSANAGPI